MTGVVVLAVVAAAVMHTVSLWVHPYGRCRSVLHRGGRNLGSSEEAWGRCPKCKGNPVPRFGAAAVARLIGKKHGRRFW